MDDEIWLAKLFNDHLPGVGNAFLKLAGMPAEPRPWAGFIVMQILVALILILLFAFLRPRLSMDRPGKLQHTFELIHDFVGGESESAMGRLHCHADPGGAHPDSAVCLPAPAAFDG